MEAVVRGTKTIEEFKRVREDMLYESGNCWQYRETASGLEW